MSKFKKVWFVLSLCLTLLFPLVFYRLVKVSLELKEIKSQRKKDLAAVAKLRKELEDVKRELSRVREFDLKLRIIANLTEKGQPMGGPLPPKEFGYPTPFDKSFDHISAKLDELEGLAKRLKVETKREKDSLSKLLRVYRKSLVILSYTPSIRPTLGYISSGFGWRISPFTGMKEFHKGIDIVARSGTPVVATACGVVIFAGRFGGYGKTVIIRHRNGFTTLYAHLRDILVKRGQRVKRGQVIGTVGSSGLSTGPHLHYEVRYRGRALNPKDYILD